MPFTDMPRSELVKYAPDLPWPEDLEEFWSATLADNRVWSRLPSSSGSIPGSRWSTAST